MLLRNPRRICKGLDIQTHDVLILNLGSFNMAPWPKHQPHQEPWPKPGFSCQTFGCKQGAAGHLGVTWCHGILGFCEHPVNHGISRERISIHDIPSLNLNDAPWNVAIPKKDGVSSSNQQFSRAFAVSFREGNYTLELDEWIHNNDRFPLGSKVPPMAQTRHFVEEFHSWYTA